MNAPLLLFFMIHGIFYGFIPGCQGFHQNLADEVIGFDYLFVGDGVIDIRSITPGLDNAFRSQDAQML